MPLPRAPPAAVRQTMQHAFEDLEKVITPQDSKDYHDCSLERVRLEALQIENQLGSRGWLRNMRRLRPLFTGLEHYSKVVDTLCNGTPFLPWVWAPITLILRIASEHIESFDSLIGAYGRIGSSLQRFEILHKSFIGDARFHESTAAFYADILELHKHAYKFVRRSGWKLLFSTSWGRFQRRFGNILEDLKRHEDLIDRLVNAIDISEARQLRQELSSWREESLQKISLEDKEQSAKEFQAIQSWLRVNECDQLAIFETAAGPGNRFPGTCGWVLNNTKIRSWLQKSPQSSILWLSGVAGSGKSVISSQLINFIRSRKDVVLYHFCTNVSIASSEYEQVLKSLLEQLLRQDGDLTASVYTSYVLTKKEAAVPTLEKLLLDLLITSAEDPNQQSYIWIVLDGVDELREHSPNSQSRLLNFIKQIVSKTTASENVTCKAFISCRPSKTVSHLLRQKPTVSLTDEKKSLSSAIQEYALQRLRALMTRFQQLGLTALEIEDIGRQISLKSDGMFLYARLVLDFVSSNIFVRGDELRNSINQLPRELSAFYLQLLSQILAPLDQNSKRHIECIFGWVAFARRPLRKSELLSAVGFSSGDPDTGFPAPQYILDVCRTLIEERSDTTLTFIHVSVKEFLQSSTSSLKVSEEAAVNQHCIASITCLLSSLKLLDQDRQQAFQILVRGVYGFQLYATEYWTDYLLSIVDRNGGLDKRSTLYNLLCQLCTGVDSAVQDDMQDRHDNNTCDDKRLDKLKEHQDIHRNVRKALWARSPKQLEQRLRIESTSDATKARSATVMGDGVSGLLPQYQNLLLHVMNEVDIPGVSSRDLEAFRSEFSTSIHTCRLRTCARATVGFETKDLRIEHEKSHVQRYPCTRMGCQYPPFLTPGSLKAHVRKEHDTAVPPRSIRRVKTAATNPDTSKGKRQAAFIAQQKEAMRLRVKQDLKAMKGPQEEPSSKPRPSDILDDPQDLLERFTYSPPISFHPWASPSPLQSENDSGHQAQAVQMERENKSNYVFTDNIHPQQRPAEKLKNDQLQLMLLEQQNKKRLMMARQEQDGSSSDVPEPSTVAPGGDAAVIEIADNRRQPDIAAMAGQKAFSSDSEEGGSSPDSLANFFDLGPNRPRTEANSLNSTALPSSARSSNDVVQEYQRQLFLKEQENRRRVMASQQEQHDARNTVAEAQKSVVSYGPSVLSPPPLPPPRYVPDDRPQADRSDFSGRQSNESVYPSVWSVPGAMVARQEDFVLFPNTTSRHRSGEPRADVANTKTSDQETTQVRPLHDLNLPPNLQPLPGVDSFASMSSTDFLAPGSQEPSHQYSYLNYLSSLDTGTSSPFVTQGRLETVQNSLDYPFKQQSPLRSSMASKGESIDYTSYNPAASSSNPLDRQQRSFYQPPVEFSDSPSTPRGGYETNRNVVEQRLEALREQRQLVQQAQLVHPTTPAVNLSGLDLETERAGLDEFRSNIREGLADNNTTTTTTTGVSHNSIPPIASTATAQQHSRQSQHQSLAAAGTVVNASRREPPEPVGRATPSTANAASSYWSVAEINNFPELLRSFGTDWQAIAEHMTTKTAIMVANFYNKMVSREKPEWAEVAYEADEKMGRGVRLPEPPRRPEPRTRNG